MVSVSIQLLDYEAELVRLACKELAETMDSRAEVNPEYAEEMKNDADILRAIQDRLKVKFTEKE